MEVTWLGHSCFRLRSREVTFITDPFEESAWDFAGGSLTADVVTISHEHPHHAAVQRVEGARHVLRGPGEYEIGGASIWGVRTWRKTEQRDAAARNTVFVIRVEDLTICHLGDLGHALTSEQLEHVQDVDVLLVPVGGGGALNGAEAAAVVSQVEPRIVIPMHYARPEMHGTVPLEDMARFCKEMAVVDATPVPRLSVTATSLPAEPTVVLLEVRG